MEQKKQVIIIGGGVAGLTAALELLRQSDKYIPIVIEQEAQVGGLSRTLRYKDNYIDIGGHRFFSKDESIMKWWTDLMPLQGKPSKDDLILNNEKPLSEEGPDPEKEDCIMLVRRRISRILYLRKFFDYPVSLKPKTLINMGLIKTAKSGWSYVISQLHKRPEISLEDFMINRFGKTLYSMFFEDYTEKLWGRHPSRIDSSWGAQRIKGLSLSKTILNALSNLVLKKNDLLQKNKETSLIEQFIYPKYGPGQLWQTVADEVIRLGGVIRLNTKVVGLKENGSHVMAVEVQDIRGNRMSFSADEVISSMPIKNLVMAMETPNKEVLRVANGLPYRDFMTVGLLVDRLNLKNETNIKTVGDIIPDTWIYVQERDVKVGRLQIFNNWSPYLTNDFEHTVWIGMEYFCDEGDNMWNMSDEEFIEFAKSEMVKLDILSRDAVLDAVRYRVQKAYPAYFDTYKEFDKVRTYLDGFDNLYCVGRNGQHRYNNMDHSMLTAMEAIHNILNHKKDHSNIWNVNTEKVYHETKKSL